MTANFGEHLQEAQSGFVDFCGGKIRRAFFRSSCQLGGVWFFLKLQVSVIQKNSCQESANSVEMKLQEGAE